MTELKTEVQGYMTDLTRMTTISIYNYHNRQKQVTTPLSI